MGLNHVTEVAERVYLQTMRSPTSLHANRVYSQKKFLSSMQKDFFNSIGQNPNSHYRRLAAFGRICAFRRPAAVAPREVDRLVAAQAFARYFDSGEYSRSD
jgi:hypothetical protein